MTETSPKPAESVRHGGIEIFYASYGQGPLLLLLHGFPDNETSFAAQVEELSRDHLVVTPRLRGFPPSSAPSEIELYALPTVAEDIAAIIEHFDTGPALVVGHDWGGALAQAVALRFPHLVKGLVLLNAPLLSTFESLVNSDTEQQQLSAYTLPYLQYQEGDDKNIEFVTQNIRNSDRRRAISRYLEDNSISGMLAYYKANYASPPYHPQEAAGFIFHVPTLILWGLEEEYFAPSALNGLTRYFSGPLRLVTFPGAGHWPHQDAADRINREIRSWLQLRPESPDESRNDGKS